MVQRLVFAWVVLGMAAPLWAQGGDRPGESQPEVWREMDIPPAPPLSPTDALEAFRTAPGFRVELAAAEPLVTDPVAMVWDGRGRLWVVEMRGFMPNIDGEGEDQPVGRIVVLRDQDHDGRMDLATLFLDGLVMPRSIAIVEEGPHTTGVLVAEPPHLWLCRDTDGDLGCDEKTAVFDEYGRQGPVEHTDNGLLHAPDNWLYNAKSSLRFRFRDGELTAGQTVFRGQWGITHDNAGRLYYNYNPSWLHADLLPAEYLLRHPQLDSDAGVNVDLVGFDQQIHTVRVNPGINRGYQSHMLREDGRLAIITAASAPTIYRGGRYPADFAGNAFICDPGGNVVARFAIHEAGDGIALSASHKLYDDERWGRREFLASTDERFRPVNGAIGPDGCLYVTDMYRGVIQHHLYVTTYLRRQSLERGLDKPVGLGRIWRVVHEETGRDATVPALPDATGRELVGYLSHPNGWWRDTAQRLLVQRADSSAAEPLRSLAVNGASRLGRFHALWTLHGMGAIDKATVLSAMEDPHPRVRIAAVRTGEALIGTADEDAFAAALAGMIGDESPAVRLQVMLTLGELGDRPQALEAMAELLSREAHSIYIRHAAISGLGGRELALLRRLLDDPRWAAQRDGYGQALSDLAGVIVRRRRGEEVAALLDVIGGQAGNRVWHRVPLLGGMAEATRRPRPVALEDEPVVLASLAQSGDATVRNLVERVRRQVTWGGDEGAGGGQRSIHGQDARATTSGGAELKQRIELGKALYMAICMACHQVHGEGQDGMAPSLVGTPWVEGPEGRLVRIALDGLQGPVTVDGKQWNLLMPGHRTNPVLTDERLAAILTYIRQAWGNEAPPVEPETVQRVREATEGRTEPWTVDELERIEGEGEPREDAD